MEQVTPTHCVDQSIHKYLLVTVLFLLETHQQLRLWWNPTVQVHMNYDQLKVNQKNVASVHCFQCIHYVRN